MINAVVYARFSSHGQTEQSIEGQIAVCQQFALNSGYQIIETYIDRALTGTSDNRPEFQKMIADSNKRHFQAVIVYQLDRFSRDKYDNAVYKNKLKLNGVRVVSAMEPISDDASGILMESILEGMASYYSKELSQKILRGLSISLENGTVLGGSTPLGFKVVRKNNKPYYDIDAESAPTVRKIFEMYISNHTMAEIINYLNQHGVKTSKGNPYNKNSIRRILTNKRYIGTFVHKGKEYPNKMPAIIEEDIFNQAQIVMEKNKKAPARAKALDEAYILTTKLFCGKCHAPMTGVCGTSKSKNVYQYYSCVTARENKKKCHKSNIRKDLIENHVIHFVRQILTDENIQIIAEELAAINKQDVQNLNLPSLKQKLRENKEAQKNLLKAIEQGKALDTLVNQLDARKEEQSFLEIEIAKESLQQAIISEKSIIEFLQQIKNGSIDNLVYRQSMIDIFVHKIYLYDSEDKHSPDTNIILNLQPEQKEKPLSDNECSLKGCLVGN